MWSKKTRASGSTAARTILTVLFLAIAAWLWFNQQLVIDQIAVWRYQPSSEISQIADRSDMNDRGRFLFYASQPEVDGTQRFYQVCSRKEEGTAILGCYNGRQIFIYDVKDARLNGIKEVTAAHEMLHAAYQRLSDDERKKVDELVEAEYSKLENTADYKERMAFYARTEPGERDNELHSVIGTEIRSISPELESHYKKYFKDRSRIVALHETYQAIFKKLDDDAKALYDELQQLNAQINAASNKYNTDVTTLNKNIEIFNGRATDGSFTSQTQFNSERSQLVKNADSLSDKRTEINNLIDNYEEKRQQYNVIANESKQLVDSINSNLAPAPSL